MRTKVSIAGVRAARVSAVSDRRLKYYESNAERGMMRAMRRGGW